MYAISLIETGHSGLFLAKTALETVGTLSFRISGPRRITVEGLTFQPGLVHRRIAHQLLDALHRYAYEADAFIHFQCPKAKAINDHQIAQELRGLALPASAVA
ncbi:hypothetical protein [Hufsiella ginkgonis]|uniref:N-acetyltransferase n=1 Tax=Hufsiella ginkgonis TaxID=2695274 RepID=A0A7K1XUB4_9SPHI|nr:hypothetical protein [Hufsiella ginkgonis]MXV14086.1 hypothetical protein [Hufsiella ginkgonis]